MELAKLAIGTLWNSRNVIADAWRPVWNPRKKVLYPLDPNVTMASAVTSAILITTGHLLKEYVMCVQPLYQQSHCMAVLLHIRKCVEIELQKGFEEGFDMI